MVQEFTARRRFLSGMAVGAAATLAASRGAAAADNDGHASGYDAAPAGNFMKTVPRKPGDPVTFSVSLDRSAVKSTSGGWAREVNARHLPLATGIAGAHLFMNPGGSREMHWHATAAEWAFVLTGQCQVIVVDPDGELDVANYGPGDLWFFPKGHAHAISTLGDAPCHALLTFDDGFFSERGTFGISDWVSRVDAATLALNFGVPTASVAAFPQGETYINQGEVIALDSEAARAVHELPPARSHRFRLMAEKPWRSFPGGTLASRIGARVPDVGHHDRPDHPPAAWRDAGAALASQRQRVVLRLERAGARDAVRRRQAHGGCRTGHRRLRLLPAGLGPFARGDRQRALRDRVVA